MGNTVATLKVLGFNLGKMGSQKGFRHDLGLKKHTEASRQKME